MKTGLLVGYLTMVLGQTVAPLAPELGTITQMGALGVLAWVAYCQRAEIRSQREELSEIRREHTSVVNILCDRWDGWEKQRHKDSEQLDTTLKSMIRHCAESQQR